ncbi:MAG: recombinase family protein [Pseudonocardiaceae bacterium]
MLRNPAYAGKAVFGKTMVINESPGLNRRARLEGRSTPRASKTVDRPRTEWVEIAVPAIVSVETFERVAARLADNKRYASRNSTTPSLLQGLAACAGVRIRLLPDLDPDHEQEDLLLPLLGLG